MATAFEDEEKKRKARERLNKKADEYIHSLAKDSKETIYNDDGYRMTAYQQGKDTRKRAGNFPAPSSKGGSVLSSLLSSPMPRTGGTINPVNPMIVNMPTVDDFKALLAKKQPTVNINLDKKPIQSMVTVNPTLVTATKKAEPLRSTAKDRKTMLYETNDSLLTNDEIFEKYQYVLNDKDMDYETQKKAVEKGIPAVGKTLHSSADYTYYNKVANLQAGLQGKLKSTAFTAGFLDATSGDLKDVVIKHSGNESLQKQNEALKQSFGQMQQANPGYYTGGNVTGEISKAAAGYMTAGAAAEAALAKGAQALGTRMLSATAPDAAQKLAALVKYNPNVAKAAAFSTRMLGQQAADTAVNTPITIAAGMVAGKDKKQISSDVAKQQAMDLGFNLGFGALQAGGKVLNDVATTKKTQKNIAVQMKNSMTGKMPSNEYIKLGETPEILKRYGMTNGEMLMPQTVVPKVAYPAEYRQALAKGAGISDGNIKNIQGHNLGFEAIRQLPEKMKKPVAILKSETQDGSIVVLTDMIDAYKQPVIVPIRVGKTGFIEFSNVIPSMYGRQGFTEFMEKQKKSGNILYLNKKTDLQKLLNSGLQLPESYSNADPMLILAREKGKVKDAELKNIAKGNMLGKIEDVASSNARSPQRTSDNVTQLSSVNNIYKMDGNSNQNLLKMESAAPTSVSSPLDTSRTATQQRSLNNIPKKELLNNMKKTSAEMDEKIRQFVEDSDFDLMDADNKDYGSALGIKDLGFSGNTDIYRILEKAAGDNESTQKFLRETIKEPLDQAKKQYVDSSIQKIETVLTDIVKQLNIKEGSLESAAAQWYREGYRLNRFGEKEIYTLHQLKMEFPNRWQDIIEAGRVAERIYGEYPELLNQNYKKIYPNIEINAISKIKQYNSAADEYYAKARIEKKSIEKLEVEIAVAKQTMENGANGSHQVVEVEKSILTKENQLNKAKNQLIAHEKNGAAKRAKAKAWEDDLASGAIYENKRLVPIENYAYHFTREEKGFSGLKRIGEIPREIDPRLEGLSEFTQPKTKFAGFMQHRKGGYYDADIVGGLLRYVKEAEYKAAFDPLIADLRKVTKGIAETTKDSRNANNFINAMIQFTNDLAGKTNPYFDRMLTLFGGKGRKVLTAMEWVNNRAKANAVMGNMRSAVAQFYNLPNAAIYIKNPVAWSNGAKLLADGFTNKNGAKEIFDSSTFLNERYAIDKLLSNFDDGILKYPEKFATWLLTAGDEISTRLIWASAYQRGLKTGVSDVARYADDITRRAVGGRGIGEVPILQKSRSYKFFLPFMLEVNNSLNVVKDAVGQRDIGGLALWMVASYIMNSIPRETLGFDVSTDFINALKDGIDSWDNEESTAQNIQNIAGRLGGEAISMVPSGSMLTSLALRDENERKKLFGDSDPTRFGTGQLGLNLVTDPIADFMTGQNAAPSLLHTGLAIAPPFMGRQIERGVTAAQDFGLLPRVSISKNGISSTRNPAPGSYNASGKLRFPIENTPENMIKDFAVGPYATNEGKQYIKENKKAFSDKNTSIYNKLAEKGIVNMQAYGAIGQVMQAESSAGKRRALRLAPIKEEGRPIIYYDLLASEKDRGVMDTLKRMGEDDIAIYDCVERLEDSNADNKKRNILLNSKLSGESKKYVYREKVTKDDDKRIYNFSKVGMDMDKFLKVKNNLYITASRSLPTAQKREMFVNWVLENGFSSTQRSVIYEEFNIAKKYRR
ncbi:hypothetical protein [Anaerotignum propionicum]|uniref:MuF-C-terminal domain-containing protein n=1 Tax=Anaerotignum propionicum TaxID=28446 RepID=UPI002899DA41|nr:hypothetical protein [Anaerotignum propionicum]